MSTPAALVVRDETSETIAVVYKHWDGYPEGVLSDVQRIFTNAISCNGLPPRKDCEMFVHINDMDDFAAQLVVALKTQPGDVYLYPSGSENEIYTNWTYIFTAKPLSPEHSDKWLWVDIIQGNATKTPVWSGFLMDWKVSNA